MIKWYTKKHPYPLIADVMEALREKKDMIIVEHNYRVDPSDICNFFGPQYINEIKRKDNKILIRPARDFTFNSEHYLVNPFLTDLEKYIARCSIEDTYREEKLNDVQLLASFAMVPEDLYLREFVYRGSREYWYIDHSKFVELVKNRGAKLEKWSLNSWHTDNQILSLGNDKRSKYYDIETVREKIDVLPESDDLKDLLQAAEKYMVI